MPIDTVFLDAGGVLIFPNWTRVSAALAAHGVVLTEPVPLFASTLLLSNIVSNVPAVMLLLPAATPVLVAAVEGTGIALGGAAEGYAGFSASLKLLALFAIVYATVSYLVFEHVVEE